MKREFFKYEGAGNDFIIFDHRQPFINYEDTDLIARLCDRRRGIGADGLILLEPSVDHDFKMVYFNSDGRQSSMCGNGGRCVVAFARRLGLIGNEASFTAIDGPHEGLIHNSGEVSVKMSDVDKVQSGNNYFVLDTGSPHYVKMTPVIDEEDIEEFGRTIRYSKPYADKGINVNLMQTEDQNLIKVRTYERGVEAETLACGTGVTACAIVLSLIQEINTPEFSVKVRTKGNDLLGVKFRKEGTRFVDIWLTGPATFVFSGKVNI